MKERTEFSGVLQCVLVGIYPISSQAFVQLLYTRSMSTRLSALYIPRLLATHLEPGYEATLIPSSSHPHPLTPSHSTVQKGSLLIDSSTIEMSFVKQVAAKATDVGANFIDAPVSGGKQYI